MNDCPFIKDKIYGYMDTKLPMLATHGMFWRFDRYDSIQANNIAWFVINHPVKYTIPIHRNDWNQVIEANLYELLYEVHYK